MRVTTNTKLISTRRRFGSYANFVGLGILLVGMLAAFRPTQSIAVWISLAALIAGFGLTRYGMYTLRRFGRSPRPDEIIEAALKGMDDRYQYYSWALPVPYVLLSPQGIYTFITRDQSGQISVTGAQWHTKFNLGRLFLGQESLGNPTRDALEAADKLQKWISESAPGLAVAVQPAIVFIDERTQLTVSDPTVPVLRPDSLKKWLRGSGKVTALKAADYRRIEALFNAKAAGVEYTDPAAPANPAE
jgi:hypothetical protein